MAIHPHQSKGQHRQNGQAFGLRSGHVIRLADNKTLFLIKQKGGLVPLSRYKNCTANRPKRMPEHPLIGLLIVLKQLQLTLAGGFQELAAT